MQRMQIFILDAMHLLMQLSNARQLIRFWDSFHRIYRNKIFLFEKVQWWIQGENINKMNFYFSDINAKGKGESSQAHTLTILFIQIKKTGKKGETNTIHR